MTDVAVVKLKYFINDWNSDCFILWEFIEQLNFKHNRRRHYLNSKKGKTYSLLYGLTPYKAYKKNEDRVKDPNSNYYFTNCRAEFPELQGIFEEFSLLHFPSTFNWNSVMINKNLKCKAHKDKRNIGSSLLLGLGDYSNGELKIENTINKTWHNKLIFNGSKLFHETMDWAGDRYTLIFFINPFFKL
jgi:hypothetical protein